MYKFDFSAETIYEIDEEGTRTITEADYVVQAAELGDASAIQALYDLSVHSEDCLILT